MGKDINSESLSVVHSVQISSHQPARQVLLKIDSIKKMIIKTQQHKGVSTSLQTSRRNPSFFAQVSQSIASLEQEAEDAWEGKGQKSEREAEQRSL